MDQNNFNFENESLENELNNDEIIETKGIDGNVDEENFDTFKLDNEPLDSQGEKEVQISEFKEAEKSSLEDKIKGQKRAMKVPLVLSLFGLILSLFCGSGLPLSIVGFILANVKYKKIKSQSLLWAKNLGLLGIIMNVVFTVSLSIFIAMMEIANPDYSFLSLLIF